MSAPKSDDPRLGQAIAAGDDGQVVLLGYACDEGVRRNGGRVGAKAAPAAVRRALAHMGTLYNPELDIDLAKLRVTDAGDVVGQDDGDLEGAHALLERRVGELLAHGGVPFVVGGGNDQSAANGRALLAAKAAAGCVGAINVDAHLDVRPLLPPSGAAHSGSPFRELLDDARLAGRNFVAFAAQGGQCSAAHVGYLHSKGAHVVWMSALRRDRDKAPVDHFKARLEQLSESCTDIFVSFDIDSISGADAPGVSCVATYGLSAADALDIAFAAGCHPKVSLFDCSEFNPSVEEHRTARLVVNMFYYFCLGVAVRKEDRGIGQM